jgi:pimeloyl-ACP methyl ester carboxylesterase
MSRNFCLVPGAWHGGWSWRPVAERLRAAGHTAFAVTLPGLGDGDDPSGWRLQDAVDHIVAEIERRNLTDAVLLPHSWAGYPVSGVVERLRDRISQVVYYNAQVPVAGRSMIEDNPPEAAAMLRGLIDASPTRAIAPNLGFVQQIFMQDVSEDAQRLLAELLTPQAGGYFLDALDVPTPAKLGIPVRYVLADDDHALPRPGTEFAARLGVEPIAVPGTHEGMLTHPNETAEAILGP